MRRTVVILLLGAVLSAVGVLVAAPASACSCATQTTAEYLGAADTVFVGRLVSREVQRSGPAISSGSGPAISSGDPALHVFAVETVYKGDAHEQQGVVSADSGASCGLELHGDGPFLVFATRSTDLPEGQYMANLCGGTTVLTPDLRAELAALTAVPIEPSEARDPLPGAAGTGPDDGLRLPALVAAGVLALTLAGWLVVRRRRATVP